MMEPWKPDLTGDAAPGLEQPTSVVVDPPPFPASYYQTPQEEDAEICHGPLWKRVFRWVLTALLIALPIWWHMESRPLPEVGPFEAPRQERLVDAPRLPGPAGFEYEPVATYSIDALVLSRKRYRWEQNASFCPVDLALGWGPTTSRAALDHTRYWQSGRWYWYRVRSGSPITARDVHINSANTHLILPEDDPEVRKTILSIRRGHVVRLDGYLVNVHGPNGLTLRTSTTRDDGGAGSCEILYVKAAEVW